MIEVTITLHNANRPEDSRVLYKLAIYNDKTGTPELGNYKIYGDDFREDRMDCLDRGEITNYPRRKGFMKLVHKALAQIIKQRGDRDVQR